MKSSSPKLPQKFFDGEGGSYSVWSTSDLPLLSDEKVGAGKLVLQPLGFALPHYADSAKVGYVIQGKGLAGLVLAGDRKEKIVTLNLGDAILVPMGAVSWWYNDGESNLSIVFLGDTSKAHSPGAFTYFFLTGGQGIFTGFSAEFMARASELDEEEAGKLFGSQLGFLIVKLQERLVGLEASAEEGMLKRTLDMTNVENGGGSGVLMTGDNFPLLKEVNFSAELMKLAPAAMWSPGFSADGAARVIFVVRGSGTFQIVGFNGQRVFDSEVKDGGLFVVPRFFVVSAIAGGEGMEWFAITPSPRPVVGYLAGKTSILKSLSPQVLRASLNVTPEAVKLLRSKGNDDAVFMTPRN